MQIWLHDSYSRPPNTEMDTQNIIQGLNYLFSSDPQKFSDYFQHLLAHMILRLLQYMESFVGICGVFLIRDERFPAAKTKLKWEACLRCHTFY